MKIYFWEVAMEYLNKFKKEPRLILAALNILFFLFPWVSVKVEVFGFSEKATGNGFNLMSDSFPMFLLLLIPAFIIALPFIPALKKYIKMLNLVVPLAAIILTFIIYSIATNSYNGGGFDLGDLGIKIHRSWGFWLTILSYLGMLVSTLIFDYKVNKQSFTGNGIKGVFSDIANQASGSSSETAAGASQPKASKTVVCPACNETIPGGTKFCLKCGAPMPEVKKCVNCGKELAEGVSFCAGCGTKVE